MNGLTGNNILTKSFTGLIKYTSPILIALCLSVVSCSDKSGPNGKSIIYWSSNNTEEIKFAKEIVSQWNKNNYGKEVTFQPVRRGSRVKK